MESFKISICIPSYKRPKVETLDYIPFAKVYIDGEEEEDYKKSNPKGTEFVIMPEGVQGNIARVRNYILDNEFNNGTDIVMMVDDDMKGIYYFENEKAYPLKTEDVISFVYKYSLMALDMDVHYWGVNLNSDKQNYREYTPFSLLSFVGGPLCVFVKDGGLRYDENLPLKEDYDMTLQQLNKYRRVLRVNKYYYQVRQSTNKGGCATYRSIQREKDQLKLLQKKWGSKIVKNDMNDRSHTGANENRKFEDYNPVIKVPIKGV